MTRLLTLAGLIAVVYSVFFLVKRDYQETLREPLGLTKSAVIEVPKGSNLDAVVADFDQRHWLRTPRARLYLRLYGRLNPRLAALKAGEYQVMPGQNGLDALSMIAAGRMLLHELRIIEGWRFSQALDAVKQSADLEHALPPTASAEDAMQAIERGDEHPEGRFFPDTYRFTRGTTDVAILQQAYAAAEKLIKDEWARRDANLPYQSPYQAVIMASIVEKETAKPDERAQVAGVFVRRLQKGMRLQTDPTVIYGLGASFDGNLRKRDLLTNAPYNTYTREGLPPTPICLPGRASLLAALHPAQGDALYFVSRGDGTHQFSSNLKDQDAAVRRYQLGREP